MSPIPTKKLSGIVGANISKKKSSVTYEDPLGLRRKLTRYNRNQIGTVLPYISTIVYDDDHAGIHRKKPGQGLLGHACVAPSDKKSASIHLNKALDRLTATFISTQYSVAEEFTCGIDDTTDGIGICPCTHRIDVHLVLLSQGTQELGQAGTRDSAGFRSEKICYRPVYNHGIPKKKKTNRILR